MNANTVALSTVLVAGQCRARAQRVLDAIAAQTCAADMEIIVVDATTPETPHLQLPEGARVIYLHPETPPTLPEARAAAVRYASADYVAFLEDHCYPQPGWAEALIQTTKENNWAAIGYSFINANPKTYTSRACMLADYILFADPISSGERNILPGNNIAYRKDLMLEFGDKLAEVISPDFIIQDLFRKRGLSMYMESNAKAAHENFEDLSGMLWANYTYCRLIANGRVESQKWGWLRRLVYGAAVPIGAPAIKLFRLLKSITGRRSLWLPVLEASPVILIVYLWSAAGEALGYLFGKGTAEEVFDLYELHIDRINRQV